MEKLFLAEKGGTDYDISTRRKINLLSAANHRNRNDSQISTTLKRERLRDFRYRDREQETDCPDLKPCLHRLPEERQR
jgi:hypothetical protein